ncbi:MAG TPA: FAD-dependent oxidoreductase, partial [Actinophytocola sp.]|nr:FAD-dependent oxidoreductase [Actinophytocola sp.]
GAQADRVDGGAHQVCVALAEKLDVRLRAPVHAVHAEATHTTVHSGQRGHRADAVVMAVPPLLADAIDYRPGLAHRRAGSRTARGTTVKVHLVYPQPMWRDHGLSGWSVNAEGPLLSTVDDSPAAGGAGVLTGFVTGSAAAEFAALPVAEQRSLALAQAARIFPRLPAPIGFHTTDWTNETYSRGCYAALFGPGDWPLLGPHLTAPHGRVHWAGTETSFEFFGLMEGAIRSGHRVAAEIVTRHETPGSSR